MRTILLSAFCTLVLNVQSTEVKLDTIQKYIIDKQVVKNFNGTQLEGKTISKYIIAYKNVGKTVEKTHIIYTNKPTNIPQTTEANEGISSIKLEGDSSNKTKALIIIDGKETVSLDFKEIKPESIASVNVYKPGSKVAESYGEKGLNGVIMVVTKNNKSRSDITYFIDGQRVNKQMVDNLDPTKIASMNVNKADGNSVIEITTKK